MIHFYIYYSYNIVNRTGLSVHQEMPCIPDYQEWTLLSTEWTLCLENSDLGKYYEMMGNLALKVHSNTQHMEEEHEKVSTYKGLHGDPGLRPTCFMSQPCLIFLFLVILSIVLSSIKIQTTQKIFQNTSHICSTVAINEACWLYSYSS